jgi:hypothetical protein
VFVEILSFFNLDLFVSKEIIKLGFSINKNVIAVSERIKKNESFFKRLKS